MSILRHVAGVQLAQVQLPPHSTPGAIFDPPNTGQDFAITLIWFCNPSDSAQTIRLFHDDDGTTFAASTALIYDKSLASKAEYIFNAASLNGGIALSAGGTIGGSCNTDGAVTATVYGVPGQPDSETENI